jgi:VCBS repeat-containing protein
VIVGPDSNVWFAGVYPGSTRRMEIATYVLDPMKVTPTSLTLSGPGATGTLTVTESGVTSWTAKSSAKSVATVKKGSGEGQFVVTAVAAGTCQITISDSSGNSVSVKITVS